MAVEGQTFAFTGHETSGGSAPKSGMSATLTELSVRPEANDWNPKPHSFDGKHVSRPPMSGLDTTPAGPGRFERLGSPPMPDNSSGCGELIVPALTTTSREAQVSRTSSA